MNHVMSQRRRATAHRPDGVQDQGAHTVSDMASIVLRVRLTTGDQIDLRYEDPDLDGEEQLIDRVVAILAEDSGVLRCRHGDRLIVVYGRGVATFEVSPRGAVL